MKNNNIEDCKEDDPNVDDVVFNSELQFSMAVAAIILLTVIITTIILII